jgi:hypothetical protein
MSSWQQSCQDQRVIGTLLTHEVQFNGPGAMPCELPERLQGHISHVFTNRSIYPYSCVITAATQPQALTVVGPASTAKVHVSKAQKKPLRVIPGAGTASQQLEHLGGTGLGLPHTGSASFTTVVTGPWGACPPAAVDPSVGITLTP